MDVISALFPAWAGKPARSFSGRPAPVSGCAGAAGQALPNRRHGVLVPDCGPQHSQQEQHQQPTASVVLSAGGFPVWQHSFPPPGPDRSGPLCGRAGSLFPPPAGNHRRHGGSYPAARVRRCQKTAPCGASSPFCCSERELSHFPAPRSLRPARAHHPPGCLGPGKGQPDGIRLFRFETGTGPFLDLRPGLRVGVAQCPKVKDLFGPGHCFQTGSSRAPAAASLQTSRRSWVSSALTTAAARLVSPAPYRSASN